MNENTERLTTADIAGRTNEADIHEEKAAAMAHDNGAVATQTEQPLIRERDEYSHRWQDIQARFVDEPQESVREADALVADVIQKLAQRFSEQRDQLEGRWRSGSEVSTEDLRQALQQYRTFFQRLLST